METIRTNALILDLVRIVQDVLSDRDAKIRGMMGREVRFVYVVVLNPNVRRSEKTVAQELVLVGRAYNTPIMQINDKVHEVALRAARASWETGMTLRQLYEDAPFLVTDMDPSPDMGCASYISDGGLIVGCAGTGLSSSECAGIAADVATDFKHACVRALPNEQQAQRLSLLKKAALG